MNTSPLSAPEAAAAGLITGINHRSHAIQTLLHSAKSAEDPATLVDSQQKLLVGTESARKIGMAIVKAKAPSQPKSAAQDSDSAAQAVHSATHVSDSVVLKPEGHSSAVKLSSAAEGSGSSIQDSSTIGAALLAQSSAADAELPSNISSKPIQLATPSGQETVQVSANAQLARRVDAGSSEEHFPEEANSDLVRRIQGAAKPMKKALVVQITPEALDLKCCPAVPMSKYIQVHQKLL